MKRVISCLIIVSFSVFFQPKSIFIPQETHSTEDDNQGTIKRCPTSESPAKPSQVPPRPPPPRLPPQKPIALGNGGRKGERSMLLGFSTV